MFDDKSIEVRRFTYSMDAVLTVVVFILSFWLRNIFVKNVGADFYSHVALIPLLLSFIMFFLSYFGAYKGPRHNSIIKSGWIVFQGLSISIFVLLAVLFVLDIQYVSRLVILIFSAIEFVALISIRGFVRWHYVRSVRKGVYGTRVLIIGTGDRAKELSQALKKNNEWGIEILGYLDPDQNRVGKTILNAPVIGTTEDISDCLKNMIVDEVIIAIPRSMLEDVELIAYACEEEGIKLRFMADVFNLQVARIGLTIVNNIPLLNLEPVAHDEIRLIVKRCVDLLLTLLSMPVFLPLMGIIAIAIKMDSKGPIFFVQERVGLKKRLFPMLKFRSMCDDAEKQLKNIEHLNEAEGPIFKIANDPRITRIGGFLRKTSLDELPQLFNVLRGEMSLVGPRPMSIRDVNLFDKGIQRKRFSVKPGLTCLWQVSGRSNLPFNKWLELDLNYIENWSLYLDFKILFKTIFVVLRGSGAV